MPATRGEPTLHGSKAVQDMAYPAKHASDIEDAAPIYHNPVGTSSGYAPVWDGSKYVSTDVLTPAEHTAIGNGAPHHAALTLGANPGLVLSTQELVLGTPSTLTVSTTNAVTGANHTHAITSSANPGAAASILATDASGYLTLTQVTTTVQLVTSNAEVTVANKNKYLPYLQDTGGVYLRHQTYYWNGGAYVATEGYGVGHYALQNNTGDRGSGFGYAALYSNAGANSNGFGYLALYSNAGANSNGFGYLALYSNTGAYSNGFGGEALRNNTGTSSNGFGYGALYNNTGANSNGFGYAALFDNTGANSNGFGYGALWENTSGAGNTAMGHNAGRGYTDNAYSVFLGYDARTASGTLTNCIVIGANARGTKSNQVYLGHTDIVETYLQGKVGVQITPTAYLTLPAGSATATTAPLKLTSGTLLTTAEAGAVEFLTDDYFATITTGAARKGIVLDDGARLTDGKYPIAHTNGRLIDGPTPLAGTKVYYVSDSSGGAVTRKLTFIDGILTAET